MIGFLKLFSWTTQQNWDEEDDKEEEDEEDEEDEEEEEEEEGEIWLEEEDGTGISETIRTERR